MDSLSSSKMTDLISKLNDESVMVQYKSIGKLYLQMKQMSSNETEKRKTLNLIMDSIGTLKSRTCRVTLLNMLTQCCREGLVDLNVFINSLLSLINSKYENSFCLATLTKLMILFHDYLSANYSIQNPSHPFIDLLRNSNESQSNRIFIQITNVYERLSVNQATSLFKPVFVYVFLEKSAIKHLFASLLISKMETESSRLICELVNLYLKFLKENEMDNYLFIQNLNSLTKILANSSHSELQELNLVQIVGKLIRIDQTFGFDCSNDWKLILNLANENNRNQFLNEELMDLLAENVTKITQINSEGFFDLTHYAIKNYSNNKSKVNLASFIPGILSYTAVLSVEESFSQTNKMKKRLQDIMEEIELKLKDANLIHENELFQNQSAFDYEEVHNRDGNALKVINKRKLNKLLACLIINEIDLNNQLNMCETLNQLVKEWPHLYAEILTVYIYKIKTSNNPQLIEMLLRAMVNMVTKKVDISLCLNVLVSLMESADKNYMVKLVCMNQLAKLCKNNFDHIAYPYLAKELVKSETLTHSSEIRLEILYTKAHCIFEIISHRPDYYAQKLIATISNLLNTCNEKDDEGVCALLIDTLSFLCDCEVVDLVSTWNALVPLFKIEKRVLTLNAFCRFVSVVAKFEHLNVAEQPNNFYNQMVKLLWSICLSNLSNSQSIEVANCSFKSLAKFNKDTFKCSYLPLTIQEKIKEKNWKLFQLAENKEKSIDEIIPKIPTLAFILLFRQLDSQTYEGFGELLKTILKEEIDSIPRGTFSQAREKLYGKDDQEYHKQIVQDKVQAVLNKENQKALVQLENSTFDARFLLFSYEATEHRNAQGKIAKHSICTNWKNYEQTLKLLLSKSFRVNLNELDLNLFRSGVNRFVNETFDACVENMKIKYQIESHESQTDDSSFCLSGRETLIGILIDSFDQSSQTNIELAKEAALLNRNDLFLVYLSTLIDVTTRYVLKNYNNNHEVMHNQRKWLEVIIDFALNIIENKQANEQEHLNKFANNKMHSTRTLRFLHDIFKGSTLLFYFLSSVYSSCTTISISSYLLKYIDSLRFSFFDSSNESSLSSQMIMFYSKNVQHLIKSSEFSLQCNVEINNLIQNLFDSYSKSAKSFDKETWSDVRMNNYLISLTACLNCLYNDESVFYDEHSILEKLQADLFEKISKKVEPFESKNQATFKTAMECLASLSAIAFKSNLLDNQSASLVYKLLAENNCFCLQTFYCRYLVSYGFYEAIAWFKQDSSKWMQIITDFKLNLIQEKEQVSEAVKSLLCVLSGHLMDCHFDDTPPPLSHELEKSIKAESIINNINELFKKEEVELIPKLKYDILIHLSFFNFQFALNEYKETYSSPNSFDYLDDMSLLKLITNELFEMNKGYSGEQQSQERVNFIIKLLLQSLKESKAQQLPPINWYFFASSVFKSKYGQDVETELMELTLLQISYSNSAYSLIKNYFVDTNYFFKLKSSTQLVVFDYLKAIFKRLNKDLLRKFLSKVNKFLKELHAIRQVNDTQFNNCISAILNSLNSYLADKEIESGTVVVKQEVLELFKFIVSEFEFNPIIEAERRNIILISETIMALNDDAIFEEVIDLDEYLITETRYLMNLHLRCELVAKLYKPLVLLNDSIDLLAQQSNLVDQEIESNIMTIIANSLIRLTNQEFKLSQQTADILALNKLRSSCLNWLINFMAMIKSNASKANPKSVELLIRIFAIVCYAWSKEISELKSWHQFDIESVWAEFHTNLSALMHKSTFKNIEIKMFEWLISLLSLKTFAVSKLNDKIESALLALCKCYELPYETWLKLANNFNKII